MGKFSGILICSDFDGTIAVKSHVVEKNIHAIRYFQQNGGMFSVITGRTDDFLRSRESEIVCNAPVGCVNGTVIYDYPNSKTVKREFIHGDLLSPLIQIHKKIAVAKDLNIFHDNSVTVIYDGTDDYEQQLREALCKPVLKVLIHTTRPYTDNELEKIKEILGDDFEQARSWQTGLEIQNRGNNKGRTAREIAKLCNAKKLICVGDYENDLSLLEAADISYAVDNALLAVKQAADRISVGVEDGVIAAIVADLENE